MSDALMLVVEQYVALLSYGLADTMRAASDQIRWICTPNRKRSPWEMLGFACAREVRCISLAIAPRCRLVRPCQISAEPWIGDVPQNVQVFDEALPFARTEMLIQGAVGLAKGALLPARAE